MMKEKCLILLLKKKLLKYDNAKNQINAILQSLRQVQLPMKEYLFAAKKYSFIGNCTCLNDCSIAFIWFFALSYFSNFFFKRRIRHFSFIIPSSRFYF